MRPALLCLVVLLLAVVWGFHPPTAKGEPNEISPAVLSTAHELEKRLMAPCCWRETLDTHESAAATGMRQEIRMRIAKGESVSAIEEDLVRRHGSKLRAALPDNLGYILFGFASLFGIAVLRFMLKKNVAPQVDWHLSARRSQPQDLGISPAELRRLEGRLDDDLD